MAIFKRLVRFEDASATIQYGEIPLDSSWDSELEGLIVRIYEGRNPWDLDFILTEQTEKISKVREFLNPKWETHS
jgi:hypothetical protein